MKNKINTNTNLFYVRAKKTINGLFEAVASSRGLKISLDVKGLHVHGPIRVERKRKSVLARNWNVSILRWHFKVTRANANIDTFLDGRCKKDSVRAATKPMYVLTSSVPSSTRAQPCAALLTLSRRVQ